MVDTFWNKMMSIKKIAIVSGFNASHAVIFNKKDEDKYLKYNVFHGYDLKWLTSRSMYRWVPKNTQMKMDETSVMTS
jgi:hypothetical protein